jgi:hypothetical protein
MVVVVVVGELAGAIVWLARQYCGSQSIGARATRTSQACRTKSTCTMEGMYLFEQESLIALTFGA